MPVHEGAALDACAAIVAGLRAAALDPGSDLAMVDRRALATLAAAVEAEVARRAGTDPAPFQAAAEGSTVPDVLSSAARQDGGDA